MAQGLTPTKAEIEAAAAALGKHLGPLDGCSRWSPGYLDKVRWPHDYTEKERSIIRSAVIVMFEAVARAGAGKKKPTVKMCPSWPNCPALCRGS
jgi:hypothetical protein